MTFTQPQGGRQNHVIGYHVSVHQVSPLLLKSARLIPKSPVPKNIFIFFRHENTAFSLWTRGKLQSTIFFLLFFLFSFPSHVCVSLRRMNCGASLRQLALAVSSDSQLHQLALGVSADSLLLQLTVVDISSDFTLQKQKTKKQNANTGPNFEEQTIRGHKTNKNDISDMFIFYFYFFNFSFTFLSFLSNPNTKLYASSLSYHVTVSCYHSDGRFG